MSTPLFPYAPLDVAVELYLGGWVDVTGDVLHRDKIRITRGRSNEQSEVAPSSCLLTLDNRTGTYSTRNPTSPYYPLLGRNTPLRVGVRTAKDAFGRTVSNNWGTADVGGVWTLSGTASKFAVAAGVGTMTFAAANDAIFAYQAGQTYFSDIDVSCSVTVPFSNVLTASIEPMDLIIGGLSTVDFFQARLLITAAEVVTLDILHIDGTSVVAPVTISSFAFTGQQLRMRFQRDGQTLRAKVWPAASAEPYTWQCEGRTDRLVGRAAGWVGVRSGVAAGNTNVPFAYSFDNFEVRSNRFAGEIANFPPQWDVSGKDIYTKIEGAGLLRRLGQGQTPLKSTYLRGNQTISPAHVAYWPVEDGTTATSIASGLGGQPMALSGGATQFAADSTFAGSAPIAKPNGGRWTSPPISTAATGQIQLMFLLSVPSAGETDGDTFAQIQMSGTAGFCDVVYVAAGGGGFLYKFYDQSRTLIHTSGTLPMTVNAYPVMVSVQLTQSGSDITSVIATLDTNGIGFVSGTDTVTGATIGAPRGVLISPYTQIDVSAIGHVAIRTSITSIFTLVNQMIAYAGEASSTRIIRLGTENSLTVPYMGNAQVASQAMGTQSRSAMLDLMREAEAADVGSLHESRNIVGLLYRLRASLYNQNVALALDYSAGHLAPPFLPVEDDQNLRNDCTVTRTGGSSAQAVQLTGRLAVTSPTSGAGVGRYVDAATQNLWKDLQVLDAAGWRLHLGTVDEARYPTITVNLAKLAKLSTQLWLDALGVNVDDRITIANPKSLIAPDMITQLARGYTETFGGPEHEIRFNCAPESPFQLISIDTTGQAKLDDSDSVLAAAVSSGATTLTVASPTNQAWTTTAGSWPIPLRIAGETVTATAVANENLSNTGFEAGVSPWTSSGTSSFTQSSTQKHSGTFAARMVPDGVSAAIGPASEVIPVVGSMSVTFSVWVWVTNAVTTNFSASIKWYDAAAGLISVSSTLVSVSAATWTQVVNTFTAPANAVSMQALALLQGTPAAGQIWYIDDASVTGPQKLTVTRSVNGVVKAQAVGAAVVLARPATLGL